MTDQKLADCFTGVILGAAVGDALGLPAENLPAERIQRIWQGRWRMRFVLGRGMVSDDTEHTLMVAQALLAHPDDAKAFQRSLAWKLKWWFAGLPGGVGLATARACLKLWLGFPPGNSAVRSGGAGPAMRSAIIGAYFWDDATSRREFVLASSRLTHFGWQSETAALAVAEVVALQIKNQGRLGLAEVIPVLEQLSIDVEWQRAIAAMGAALKGGSTVAELAAKLGLEQGVSGYSLHVVPVALYSWLKHPDDFRVALISALECGGDTDTMGAIVGALSGATLGLGKIPGEWLDRLWEWPRSRTVMEKVAVRLAEQKMSGQCGGSVRYFWPGILPRNLFFLLVVLVHGFRRLFLR